MRKSRIVLAMAVLFSVILALGPKEMPTPAGAGEKKTALTNAPAKQPWEAEWDKTLIEARKEGAVVVVSTLTGAAKSYLLNEFKKYGINVEFLASSGSEYARKAIAENAIGIYSYDVAIHGSITYFDLLNAQIPFEDISSVLLLPEVKDTKNWLRGKLWYLDKGGKYFLAFAGLRSGFMAFNTKMVKPEALKSWKDLLDPRWKGKIVMGDPTIRGTAQSSVVGGVGLRVLGIGYLQSLVKQEPAILRDERLIAEWVARGKYLVGIGINLPVVSDLMAAGAPIKTIIPEGGNLVSTNPANLALFKKAPHPNAAKVFINLLLTKRLQTFYSKAQLYQSLRVDVPTEHLPKDRTLPINGDLTLITDEASLKMRDEAARVAREIFGPLVK